MLDKELKSNVSGFGYKVSLATAFLTIITFVIAVLTPPLSGPFCTADCFQYPFTDIMDRFPRDYYWIYLAMILLIFYLVMMICIYQTIANDKKHFGLISLSFTIMSTLVLFTDYFIQVSVIQPSLLAGETDGISILTQFNPHGIFIVLEEIGFIFMMFSFVAIVPAFSNDSRNKKTIKWTSIAGFILTILSFVLISFIHGIKREYRFEVAIISIVWIELIILGFLYARYFKSNRF